MLFGVRIEGVQPVPPGWVEPNGAMASALEYLPLYCIHIQYLSEAGMHDPRPKLQAILQPIRARIDAPGLSSARAKIALEFVIEGTVGGVLRQGIQS